MSPTPSTEPVHGWTAVILTGGKSRRLGTDKALVTVGGRSLLERILAGIPTAVPIVLSGPDPGPLGRTVTVVRERPVGGGPVAGLAAALPAIKTELVALVAVDHPFGVPTLSYLVQLLKADPATDAVLPLDEEGVPQPVFAIYRVPALRTAVAVPGELELVHGRSMRSLIAGLSVRLVTLPAEHRLALLDVDTPADLARARRLAGDQRSEGAVMDDMQKWIEKAQEELSLTGTIDFDQVLDVARDVAHGVARPAAPVTTYLLGLAVGAGADPAQAAARLSELAATWPKAE